MLILIAAILAIVFLYFLFWPVAVKPVKWTAPKAPKAEGKYAVNHTLAAAERLDVGGQGPEDVIFDAQGYLYSGLADGRIVRMMADGSELETFAQTGGRPLGLAIDGAGNLIVADADEGLLAVDPQGIVNVLTDSFDGRKLILTNHLDVAADGTIYFSETSDRFALHDLASEIIESGANGRLLAYDPQSGATRLVVDKLHFANGVAVSGDQSYLLVVETDRYRVQRLWLAGPKAGEAEIFIENLPGLPDNLHWNGRDTFWLALIMPRIGIVDMLAESPFLRKMIYRLPDFLSPSPDQHGYVLGLNEDGEILHNFQDPSGAFAETSGAIEHEGWLYVGSFSGNAIGRLALAGEAAQM